jgi:fructose-1,6-bisphosphatase I
LVEQEEMKGTVDGELATVLSSIATACKQIANLVTRSGISNLTGLAGAANIQVCHTFDAATDTQYS